MKVVIRREQKKDIEAIRQVHEAAFGTPAEAELVDLIEADGHAVLSLVALSEDAVVAHILFSRLNTLESRGLRASALGPLAVMPGLHRRGIASALVHEGLARLQADGEDLILVLGDPDFYERFGFSAKAAQVFQTPYDGPNLQALALTDAGRLAQGVVRYAPAFSKIT